MSFHVGDLVRVNKDVIRRITLRGPSGPDADDRFLLYAGVGEIGSIEKIFYSYPGGGPDYVVYAHVRMQNGHTKTLRLTSLERIKQENKNRRKQDFIYRSRGRATR